MKTILLFLSIALLAGCGNVTNDDKSFDRFSLVASTDGKMYRLDKKTGEIAIVGTDGIKIIGTPANDPLGIRK